MAFDAAQAGVPAVCRVTEDVGKKAFPVGALQLLLDLTCQIHDLRGGPLRQDPGMHEEAIPLT
ncbi:hypothetical protein D3C86_2193760 [compost metagenome]